MTRRKSVAGFICGLIGSLFSLFWGFWFGLIGNIGFGIIGSANGSAGDYVSGFSELYIFGWIAFIGAIVGIVGASVSLKNAKKGGIISVFSTIATSILQIYIFVQTISVGSLFPTIFIIFLLPVILQVVAVVLEFTAKPVEVNVSNQNYAYQAVQGQNQAQKSLEQELTELKNMFDKGLLTEEEYAAARKNAISKHTK